MTIFYQSFFLSFRVLGHMIVPAIGIFLGSMVVWAVLNLVTLGLAGWVSGPITMAFFSLFGMHVALGLKEGPRRIDLKMLSLYSVVFGLATMFAKAITGLAANLIAVLATDIRFGSAVSVKTLANAEQNLQTMFVLHTFGVLAIVSFLFFVIVPVVLALPMVRAAHSARGGLSTGVSLRGFWPSFLPLFMVFSVAYLALFYFQIIGFLQTFLPLFLGVILPLVLNLEFPSLPLETIAKAVVSGLVILWFNGWIWSASVLAFLKVEDVAPKPKVSKPAPEHPEAMDLRALRKSRT